MRPWLAFVLAACGSSHAVAPDAAAIDDAPADAAPPLGVDVPLASLDAMSYTMLLGVGDQQFALIIDTGSAMTGVASATCASCAGVTPEYVPGATAVDKLAMAATEYADLSSWIGEIYQDRATLIGVPTVPLDLVAVTSQNQFFMGNMYQGIVGLGPHELLEPGTNEYMDLVALHGVPDEMAFRLCADRGDIWIGGFDPGAATQPIQWTPMLPVGGSDPFYSVQIGDLAFGDTDLALTADSFGTAIVDTGTTISFVPSGTDGVMLAAINHDAAFATLFDNQTFATTEDGACVTQAGVTSAMVDAMLPPLNLSFPASSGGGMFSIAIAPSRSYMIAGGNGQFCWGFGISDNVLGGGSLIGDTLLAGMLTVFDVDDQLVGFAPEAGCDQATDRVRARPITSPFYRPPPQRRTR